MNVRARLERIERNIPNPCPPDVDPVTWLTFQDAECVDMVVRMHFLRTRPRPGVDIEATHAALLKRWQDRRDELLAGAKPSDEEQAERQRLRFAGEPPPRMVLP